MDRIRTTGQTHYRPNGLKADRTMPANPLANIEPSVGFSITHMTATETLEPMMIALTNRATHVTAFARVVWQVLFNGHADRKGLVLDELLKLVVWPIVSILSRIRLGLLALLRRLSNARKVLKSNSAAGVQRKLDNLFRDNVVDMTYLTALFLF